MKLFTFAIILGVFGTGCASTLNEPTKAPGAPVATEANASDSAQWERRKLADGVELVVSPNAGPEAQRVADMIQSEMRSRYLGAR